jgi:hypothetical protein
MRARLAEIVAEIESETRRRQRQTRKRPLGVRRILRQKPHGRPREVARSEAPRFHAASWEIRKMLEAMYRDYRNAYRDAKESLARHRLPVCFPSHGIPPPGRTGLLPA